MPDIPRIDTESQNRKEIHLLGTCHNIYRRHFFILLFGYY